MSRILPLTLIGALLWTGCAPGTAPGPEASGEDVFQVVATVGMLADALQIIGGDRVRVTALMGPGVDPHLYKASEGDLRRMMSADAIFLVGLHLEGKLTDVLAKMEQQGRPVVAVGDALPEERLLGLGEGAHDPHIWFNVLLWREAVQVAERELCRLDPSEAEGFRIRGEAYRAALTELDAWVRRRIETLPEQQRVLITAHDAFNYFGREYGFEVWGLQGISTATEAATADVQELAELIARRRLRAIFVESSVPARNIEAVQAAVKARGFDVVIGGELFSDAMGDRESPEGTYLGMVRHNTETIVTALLGNSPHE